MQIINIEEVEAEMARDSSRRRCGRVIAADGGAVTIGGLGERARIGDRILLAERPDMKGAAGEIVALSINGARAMTFGHSGGVALGDRAWLAPEAPLRPSDTWTGRIIDAFGEPLDGRPLPQGEKTAPIRRAPPPAASRGRLGARLSTGLAITDTLLPLARGQRIGVFAGSGVGKSILLARLARKVDADVVVFGLIGERGRELGEFVSNGLGAEGLRRATLVVATSDESAISRRRAAWTAMAVAEAQRDKGRHVLLILDSLTRFAEAHREIALTAGETPSLRAYPPSTANMIAALAERAGPAGRRSADGAITAIFSVLVAGSDMEEPVADITRGVLDGHIVLDRGIAERGRFPAIDVGRSVSRALPEAANAAENKLISDARRMLGVYEKSAPMIQTGLYQPGADVEIDRAVSLYDALDRFVAEETGPGEDAFAKLQAILAGGG